RDRDRPLAYYLGFCWRARSSLCTPIVSGVTGAAAGRTFSLAARHRMGAAKSCGWKIRDRLEQPNHIQNRQGGPRPSTRQDTNSYYVYVMEFEGDKIRHMTKI